MARPAEGDGGREEGAERAGKGAGGYSLMVERGPPKSPVDVRFVLPSAKKEWWGESPGCVAEWTKATDWKSVG